MAPNGAKFLSVLKALENICNVDVDAIDPRVSTAMPFKPHNRELEPVATVEWRIPAKLMDINRDVKPGYLLQHHAGAGISLSLCGQRQEIWITGVGGSLQSNCKLPLPLGYGRLANLAQSVQFCANNLKNITGRVLVQVSPSHVYSKDAVLKQCCAYDRAFREAGVSRDRYAIKISTTGPGMAAAKILNAEGIRTLGTSLFSVCQAIAASQAGCLFISPYFNG